jgi:hypothetical protein
LDFIGNNFSATKQVEIAAPKNYCPAMRAILIGLLTLGIFQTVHAADSAGRIVKVLPMLLDQQGRVALSPSLFDRDAYQFYLHVHTNEISGLRVDVLWKAQKAGDEKIKLRAELRGVGEGSLPTQKILEADVAPGFFRKWTSLKLVGDDQKNLGSLVAWRVTLWRGDQMLGEQKSFLW